MNSLLMVDEQAVRRKFPFARLVQPLVGLIPEVSTMSQENNAPSFEIGVTSLGNLTMTLPHVATGRGTDIREESLGGGGADLDPELAWVRAVAEGAERYCCFVLDDADCTIASARELGADAVAFLQSLPRCSEREYADPLCPLRPPDPTAPIRWIQGFSLTENRKQHVPAIMTHLYAHALPAENFWQSISTGVAAHTRLAAALVSAICEVIERDAIAITWMARLPLPRIVMDGPVPPGLAPNLKSLQNSCVKQVFFDATSDLGIPTIYSIQLTDGHPRLSQYVSCATSFDPVAAIAKTIREAAPVRTVLQIPRKIPDQVSDFTSLYDGAIYLGRPEHRSAFDFLINTPNVRYLSEMEAPPASQPEQQLRFLIERLKGLGMTAIAVDLTTEEVREAGLWVVRVLIPQLMPMGSIQRARYLGHQRLYQYPAQAGFGPRTEAEMNPHPQPFA